MHDQFEALRSSANHEWGTPRHIFDPLHEEFGFTLDAAASDDNRLLQRYNTKDAPGRYSWIGERVWVNPPYGTAQLWFIEKARAMTERSLTPLVVMLIPTRTDTKVWHRCIHGKAEVRFVKGRIQFVGSRWNAPFASAIVIWRSVQSI
jgi:phage N-6-adenine-methyltransferase